MNNVNKEALEAIDKAYEVARWWLIENLEEKCNVYQPKKLLGDIISLKQHYLVERKEDE